MKNDFENILFEGYLDTEGIESALNFFQRQYKDLFWKEALPEKTSEGRTSHLIRFPKKNRTASKIFGIYLIAGVHSREWIPPEILLYFLYKLYQSCDNNFTPVVLGDKTFSSGQIELIYKKLDLFVFPLVNPDGRNYSQTQEFEWRKNRRLISEGIYGVDINRNYNFMWDYEKYFHKKSDLCKVSNKPLSDLYRGLYPESEPETRNVISVFRVDTHHICFFIDIHSYMDNLKAIYYDWSVSKSQSFDKNMSFRNASYWGKIGDEDCYSEYTDSADLVLRKRLSDKMKDAISKVGFNNYESASMNDLYISPGCSRDYVDSMNYMADTFRKIHSFTIECSGKESCFQPKDMEERKQIIIEVTASLIEFCFNIATMKYE